MSKSGESSDSSNFYRRNNMPNVNGKKFPYTKKGIAEAKKAKEQKRKINVLIVNFKSLFINKICFGF